MQNNPNLPLSLWLWRQHISVYSCKLISFRWISNVSSNYIQPDLFINWHPGRCIFCLSCIRCCSKCIFCIECWRASSRNLSLFTNTDNSIDYCADTHTHTHTHTYQSVFWSVIISLEYFLESPWGGTREEDVAGKATG